MNLATGSGQATGGAGTDTVSNFENLTGSAFNDTLTGDGNTNVIEGGAGNDTINGAGGTDTVTYVSAGSAVTVNLSTGTGQNTGGAGTDTLSNFENLTGSAYNDTLTGNSSANVIQGGVGTDTINGGGGGDTLYGNDGTDLLYGADGLDNLYGGAGADDFIFQSASAFNNVDVIMDFAMNDNDAIDINDVIAFDPGTDVITDFVQVTTNGSNSEIRVDVTGSANFGGGTLIATIQGVIGLTDEAALVTSGHLVAA